MGGKQRFPAGKLAIPWGSPASLAYSQTSSLPFHRVLLPRKASPWGSRQSHGTEGEVSGEAGLPRWTGGLPRRPRDDVSWTSKLPWRDRQLLRGIDGFPGALASKSRGKLSSTEELESFPGSQVNCPMAYSAGRRDAMAVRGTINFRLPLPPELYEQLRERPVRQRSSGGFGGVDTAAAGFFASTRSSRPPGAANSRSRS